MPRLRVTPEHIKPAQRDWIHDRLKRRGKSSKHVAAEANKSVRAVNDVLDGRTGFSKSWQEAFSTVLECDPSAFWRDLQNLNVLPAPTSARWASVAALAADCLVGVSFMARDERNQATVDARLDLLAARLKDRPDDMLLRAVLCWTTFERGSLRKKVAAARELISYLSTADSDESLGPGFRESEWMAVVDKIDRGTIEEPDLARAHLEDALMRMALLRWMKSDGRNSTLAQRFRDAKALKALLALLSPVLALAESLDEGGPARPAHEGGWLSSAFQRVYEWINAQHNSGIAYALMLGLAGVSGDRGRILDAIAQACDWTDRHPGINEPLVHWGAIWLSGMSGGHVDRVCTRAFAWLKTPAAQDDRLIRMSVLWLVGIAGDRAQVVLAIRESAPWFKDKRFCDDACIRSSRLVWLMQRAAARGMIEREDVKKAADETVRWLEKNDDPFVRCALRLAQTK